jgi:DNA-binding CsgD family transcriptional regulator
MARQSESQSVINRKLEGVIAAASEAISLEEISANVIPQLSGAIGACDGITFSFGHNGMPFGIGKSFGAMAEYVGRGFIRDDPHDRVGRRDDAMVRVASELFDRKELHRSRAYREFFALGNVEYTASCRLSESGFGEPGAICALFLRTRKDPDFTRAEAALMNAALPTLQAAVRRSVRIQNSVANGKMLETVLDTLVGEPVVVFDKQGRPVWSSARTREIAEFSNGGTHPVSLSVRDQARRLAAMADRDPRRHSSRMELQLPHNGGPPIAAADLMIAREPRGATYVIARLRHGNTDSVKLAMLAEHYELTPTEALVLSKIADGLSNQEIANQQLISLETARTHVHRVLQKLGVSTRTKAALLTREF